MNLDAALPPRVREQNPGNLRSALHLVATLVISATLTAVLALAYLLQSDMSRVVTLAVAMIGLGGVYGLLAQTGSVRISGYAFLITAALISMLPMSGVLGLIAPTAVAYASTMILGVRAGAVWSVLAAVWIGFVAPEFRHAGAYPPDVSYALCALTLIVGIAAVWSENTQRRYARARRQEVADLTSQSARIRRLIHSVFPGILEVRDGNITYASHGLTDLTGYPADELLGRAVEAYVHPEDLARARTWLSRSLQHALEIRVRHRQGHWIWLSGFSFVSDDVDNDTQWTFAMRDASFERGEREQLVQQQRLEGVGVLATGVAHDFKNLLTVIGGVAELMERSEARGTIMEAVTDATDLVNKLVEFGEGRVDEVVAVDMGEGLRTMRFMLDSHLGAGIELDLSIPETAAWVGLSAVPLNQVVLNLVTNAKEAMGDHGRLAVSVDEVSIEVGAGELTPGDYWRLVISDDGCGMDEDTRARAFEPYFSSKQSRTGRGLGLSSVYGIVRQAGGSIALKSAPGAGCTVTVLLPKAVPAETPLPAAVVAGANPGNGTILVVEDEEIIADLIARNLVKAGYSVTIKNDVESAWAHLKLGIPDLLVTDIMMPDGRGTDLARRLRENAVEIPILFISGYADEEISEWRRAGGEISFLAKPFLGQELLDRVATLVAARRATKADKVNA